MRILRYPYTIVQVDEVAEFSSTFMLLI